MGKWSTYQTRGGGAEGRVVVPAPLAPLLADMGGGLLEVSWGNSLPYPPAATKVEVLVNDISIGVFWNIAGGLEALEYHGLTRVQVRWCDDVADPISPWSPESEIVMA